MQATEPVTRVDSKTSSEAVLARAIVSRGPLSEGKWGIEEVAVRAIEEDELLVDIVASGVCHTDILLGGLKEGPAAIYPKVFGHEGSGYVRAIGSNVTVAQVGDPVLLSFNYCSTCAVCTSGHPSHCTSFNTLNLMNQLPGFTGQKPTAGYRDAPPSTTIYGSFFGQSSFASTTVVSQRSVVNVKGLVHDDAELALFAPLGCGIQTGSGTVLHTGDAQEADSVVVLGLGGVGLSAVMGAKIRNCKRIIGIDKVESRLQLARELGATHVISTADLPAIEDVVQLVRDQTDNLGATLVIETTGFPPLINAAVEFTRPKGKIIQVGSAPFDAKLEIPIFEFMVAGKQYVGAVEGDSKPWEYVPQMIRWYREGRFPVEKLVKVVQASEWETAVEEMHSGVTIKPVITW